MPSRERDRDERDRDDDDDDRDRGWSPYNPRERRSLGGSSGIGGFAVARPVERQRGRGRPPVAYTRGDDRIRDDIYDRLLAQDWIDAADVRVAVEGGEVTLSGTVPTRQDKRDVEELADAVLGVREIHNQLRLGQGAADSSASAGKARPSS